jgi:Fe-S-cluster containining protein
MNRKELADQRFLVIALKEEARTVLWEVGSSVDPETLIEGVLEEIQALSTAEGLDDEQSGEELGKRIRLILLRAAYATRPYCTRCGTCCTKGSPALFREDMELLTRGVLRPEHLVTIRKGEWIHSNESDQIEQAAREGVKIREFPETRTCVFYGRSDKQCGIYESRPLQCRRQECWNPDQALRITDAEVLDREALLKATGVLWDIVGRHEQRCSYDELARAMAKLSATEGHSVQEVLDIIGFDHHVREFVVEKFKLDRSLADFFFGRPMAEVLGVYGLKLEVQPDGSFLLSPLED